MKISTPTKRRIVGLIGASNADRTTKKFLSMIINSEIFTFGEVFIIKLLVYLVDQIITV